MRKNPMQVYSKYIARSHPMSRLAVWYDSRWHGAARTSCRCGRTVSTGPMNHLTIPLRCVRDCARQAWAYFRLSGGLPRGRGVTRPAYVRFRAVGNVQDYCRNCETPAGESDVYCKATPRIEDKGMVEIILTVCAIANPANCEEKSASVRLGRFAQPMHDGCAALYRRVDWQAPRLDDKEMDLRLSRQQEAGHLS